MKNNVIKIFVLKYLVDILFNVLDLKWDVVVKYF